MSWRWAKKEVIWSMAGAQTTEQGDCSMYKGNIPKSCVLKPTVIDLLPGTPYNQQISNCCKGGVLKPGLASSFQITVGAAGTSNSTVRMAVNFMFTAPKQQYICGPTKNVMRTKFITPDLKRTTSALSKFPNIYKPVILIFELTLVCLFLFLCSDMEHCLRLPQGNMNTSNI